MSGVLAMVAGAGDLPVDLAERLRAAGEPYFVLRLAGLADERLEAHPGATMGIGRYGAILKRLKAAGVDRLVFMGKVARPPWSRMGLDLKATWGVAKLLLGAWYGDDSLQRGIVKNIEGHGFRVIGPGDVWPDLLMPHGLIAGRAPDDADWTDIRAAAAAAHRVGRQDKGQGAVARAGAVLAAEDRGHTDQLLRLVADMPGDGGVLVKLAKPQQDRRLDLPVIGPETIRGAAAARLAGVVIEAGGALLTRRAETIAVAEKSGVFLYGVAHADIAA